MGTIFSYFNCIGKDKSNNSKKETGEEKEQLDLNEEPKINLSILDEEFVIYLNSLWNSDDDNTRVLNDLAYVNDVDENELKEFKTKIENNFSNIKNVGNFIYTNKLEKEVRLSKNELTNDDIKISYLALKNLENHNQINNQLMNKINKVHICPMIKDNSKNKTDIKNYRFIQIHSKPIKLLDRLWCVKILDLIKTLDTSIFKSTIIKDMNSNIIITATINTTSRENVVLIDIEKAFDSCDYNVVENLIYKSLCRKINEQTAKKLTLEYMYLIKQRVIYYKDKVINFKKGIPTGLPSSNIIFSLIMDEIIHEWLSENNELFKISKDFTLNIFVDDIYLKLHNLSIKDIIVKTLIDKFIKYKFNVNFEKCKADKNLQLEFFTNLEDTDYYLGIPFTRETNKYIELIVNKFNVSHNTKYTFADLYNIIKNKDPNMKIIFGYLNYKLKPLFLEEDLMVYMGKIINIKN